jgi:uncharacterized LabA/DUF88 family protein
MAKYPPDQDESKNKENIVEHISYFNVLIQSISNINAAIMQEKDAKDAALNLLTDLPDTWSKEIEDKIMKETEQYDKVVAIQSKYLTKGTTQEEKREAKEKINIAARQYSRNIKKIVISLMQDKNILYQTRKQVEQGGLSLWQLGEGESEDD